MDEFGPECDGGGDRLKKKVGQPVQRPHLPSGHVSHRRPRRLMQRFAPT